jgi:hypothetical protein
MTNTSTNSKKITHIPEKYLPPRPKDSQGNDIPWSDDPATTQYLMERMENMKMAERQHELDIQKQKEDYERMLRIEKQQKEERALKAAAAARLEALPILAQLNRLQSLLQRQRTQEKLCQTCYNLVNVSNNSFVDSALSIVRNIIRKYENENKSSS